MTGARPVRPDGLGSGWTFPPVPDPGRRLRLRSGPDLVRQSILLILDTEPGERVMRPDFGCGLRRFLMEPNDPATRAAVAREVDAALRTWEARIEVEEVDVAATDDPAVAMVLIRYTLVRDQVQDGLQIPLTLGGGPG